MAEAKKKATKKPEATEAELVVEAALEESHESPVTNSEGSESTQVEPSDVTTEKAAAQPTAKAGKRSAKAIKEAEEKSEKEERKAHVDEAETSDKPKQPVKPSRSKLERRGKKFRKSAELLEVGKTYSLADAVDLAIKTSPVKFDATVELHVNLSVDPRQADQNIRDNLVLPAGTGKKVRIAVFADENTEGADLSGVDTITKALEKGELNFDILIATPANMPKLGKYARTLGPRGLMPNPKSGTVTTDVAKAVQEAKAGRVEYRVDSTGIVHLGVGKASFTKVQLQDNVQAVLASIKSNKPSNVKGNYFKAVHLTTTMGPSITVDLTSIA